MKEIYIINYDSYNMLNDKLNELTKDSKDINKYDLDEINLDEIFESASYYGLFNDKKIIIITNFKYLSGKYEYKEETEKITKFLENIDNNIKIIFVSNSILQSSSLLKKIISLGGNLIDLTKISIDDKKKYLNNYCNKNNIKIELKALDELLIRNDNNIDLIIQEINKLSLVDNFHITSDIVNQYSTSKKEIQIFDFSNAVIRKDFKTSFELLDELIKTGTEIPAIIGVLASSYINMYMVCQASKLGLSDEEIAKELNYKNTSRVYVLKKNSRIYTLDDLKNIIINLSDIDIKTKTGYDPVNTLKEFLIGL